MLHNGAVSFILKRIKKQFFDSLATDRYVFPVHVLNELGGILPSLKAPWQSVSLPRSTAVLTAAAGDPLHSKINHACESWPHKTQSFVLIFQYLTTLFGKRPILIVKFKAAVPSIMFCILRLPVVLTQL